MYFETQIDKQCVIHSWNNARGKKEVTLKALMATAKQMASTSALRGVKKKTIEQRREHEAKFYQELIGARGISSTVLANWVFKQGLLCIKNIAETRVHNITALRLLWKTHNPEFILISTELQDAGRTNHMVSVTKASTPAGSFWLMDSLLDRHVGIKCAKTFVKFMVNRYAAGWKAQLVFRNDQKQTPNMCKNKNQSQKNVFIDLDSSDEE